MNVVDIKLGTEGEFSLDLVAGVLVLNLSEKMSGLEGGQKINIPLPYYFDAIAAKAGNPFVTGVVKVLESVMVALP